MILLHGLGYSLYAKVGIQGLRDRRDVSKYGRGLILKGIGAYSSAVLRFEILFPSAYPQSPPLIIFSTEIFHPLLVPLTTYSFSGATDPSATCSASEAERLPPGSFSLKHGFPDWLPGLERGRSNVRSTNDDQDPISNVETLSSEDEASKQSNFQTPQTKQRGQSPLIKLLKYMKAAFEDSELLDTINLEAAGNASAWHAWRTHRGIAKRDASSANSMSSPSSSRNPADWNWDGLWEARVSNGIDESISDGLLFGSKNIRSLASANDPVCAFPVRHGIETDLRQLRFTKLDDDKLASVQNDMLRLHGFETGIVRQ